MRKTTLWVAAILIMASTAWAERPVNETRPVGPDASISIENVAGSLTIVGSDRADVQVTGTLGDDVEELEIESDKEGLSIEVVLPDDNRHRKGERKIAAKLEIRVPRGVALEIETVSASIDISGVSGQIDVESVSGAVTVDGAVSSVDVESVSGSVSVSGGSGSVDAESVSGQVLLTGVAGDVEAATVSGSIRVEAGAVEDVELESVAGSIYFNGQLGDGGLDVESHSGNVEVHLPGEISAEFELESFSGRIENAFGTPARRIDRDRHAPGTSAEFRTGMGDAEVSIQTFSGNIVLKEF